MTVKSTVALALVFSLTTIGGSAQEAPQSSRYVKVASFETSRSASRSAPLRAAGYEAGRGQIGFFAGQFADRERGEARQGWLFSHLSKVFRKKGERTAEVRKNKTAAKRSKSPKRIVTKNKRDKTKRVEVVSQSIPDRVGFAFGQGLAGFRDIAAKADRPSKAVRKQERARKAERKRLARTKSQARRLSKEEQKRLATRVAVAKPSIDHGALEARMGPDRGGASLIRIASAFRPFKVAKPVTKPARKAGKKRKFGTIVDRYARAYGVPVDLAHAVIKVESNYRVNARGRAGEIGLMQIKPATARMMGYRGSAKGLYSPETNIKYGMKYLGKAHKLGGGSTCGTILKYNAGHAARRMNKISARYCSKVKRHLRGS